MTATTVSDEPPAALVDGDELRARLDGRELPGAEIPVEAYESAIADHALLAPPSPDPEHAHPMWLVVLALRGMGISVEELCALAATRTQDTLLYGTCGLEQHRAVLAGHGFRTTAAIGPVTRKQSRSGAVLDFVTVVVEVYDRDAGDEGPVGRVSHGFVIKRGV